MCIEFFGIFFLLWSSIDQRNLFVYMYIFRTTIWSYSKKKEKVPPYLCVVIIAFKLISAFYLYTFVLNISYLITHVLCLHPVFFEIYLHVIHKFTFLKIYIFCTGSQNNVTIEHS